MFKKQQMVPLAVKSSHLDSALENHTVPIRTQVVEEGSILHALRHVPTIVRCEGPTLLRNGQAHTCTRYVPEYVWLSGSCVARILLNWSAKFTLHCAGYYLDCP